MAEPVKVKICGLRDPGSAAVAIEAGADMLGVILCPARRQVTLEEGAVILAGAGNGVLKVGVFVDPDADEVRAAIDVIGLDIIQLNGNESPEFCSQFSIPVMKSFEVTPLGVVPDPAPYPAGPIHLDAPGVAGGGGVEWDFSLARGVAAEREVMMSGGLKPENVEAAIVTVRPWAVDVSSGVETDGVKDPALIRAFVERARGAGFR